MMQADETGGEVVVREPTSVAVGSEQIPNEPRSLTSTTLSPTQSAESPFFEPPPQSISKSRPDAEPTPTKAAGWTLTQAESPASSFADTADENLPPPPEQSSADGFDPFLDAAESIESAAPHPGSTPNESVAVTWGDDSPPAQSEPVPPEQSEPSPAQTEPNPFLSDAPHTSTSPTPVAPAEPSLETPTFVFEEATEPAEPLESGGDDAPTLSFDPLPPQEEPQPFEPPSPEPSVVEKSPSLPPESSAQETFDPFQQSGPLASETAAAPQKVVAPSEKAEPFGYLAPPARDEPAIAKAPARPPTPTTVVEPPAWPFRESANTQANSAESLPAQTTETKMTASPFDAPQSKAMPRANESSSPAGLPPNPFSFDAADSRPIADSLLPGHPAIGEREIVVTPSDSFWSISEREYGSARYFNALAKYNKDRVEAADKLRSGMKIKIPPPEVLEDEHPESFRTSTSPKAAISPISGTSAEGDAMPPAGLFADERQQPRYRVGERETLSSIAQQVLGRSSRWTELYDLNRDQLKSPSALKIGTVLKLPPDAGRVTVSPVGGFVR